MTFEHVELMSIRAWRHLFEKLSYTWRVLVPLENLHLQCAVARLPHQIGLADHHHGR